MVCRKEFSCSEVLLSCVSFSLQNVMWREKIFRAVVSITCVNVTLRRLTYKCIVPWGEFCCFLIFSAGKHYHHLNFLKFMLPLPSSCIVLRHNKLFSDTIWLCPAPYALKLVEQALSCPAVLVASEPSNRLRNSCLILHTYHLFIHLFIFILLLLSYCITCRPVRDYYSIQF